MEKLDLPGSPERQVTSAIVCQSQGRERGGGWEVQYNIHSNLKRTFIRSYYRDCLSTWQKAKLIKLLLV